MNRYDDLISIVVPIYNVEDYLSSCIKSLVSQTYANIEIILVDDGSTDSSSKICDEYAKLDERICVIHQENGGLSQARNTGLKVSNGKYIAFIDSDDLVAKDMIEKLYFALIDNSCQISCCRYYKFTNERELVSKCDYVDIPDILVRCNVDALKDIYNARIKNIEFTAWNKLYNKKIFDDNKILYPVGKLYEDIFTTYKLLYYSKFVVFVDQELYFYRQRKGSIMNQSISIRRLDALEGHEECMDFYYKHEKYKLLGLELNAYCSLCKDLLELSECITDNLFKLEFQKVIKDKVPIIWKKYFKKCKYSILRRMYYFIKYSSIISERKRL